MMVYGWAAETVGELEFYSVGMKAVEMVDEKVGW